MTTAFKNPLPGVPSIESPFFTQIFASMDPPLSETEKRIAEDLRRDGYAIFDFPDPNFDDRAETIKRNLHDRYNWEDWFARGYRAQDGLRIQDAWSFDADVKTIATNKEVLRLLSRLYGRRAWPFQTLNFPVGTQQHYHTDSVHFSSVPERFMCGVWVALEDIDADSGPLTYYPGSHQWPIYVNEHIGRSGQLTQAAYEPLWQQLISINNARPTRFSARKGQALIWAANLLHGGSAQNDPHRTRWSQVTHYYFDDCAYYTPLHSDPFAGRIQFRDLLDISTGRHIPNSYVGVNVQQGFIDIVNPFTPHLPSRFDPVMYLAANPDVAAAGIDPKVHYLQFGFREGRKLAV